MNHQDELSELTFEQQQDITEILEGYRSNPSNSNKFRYELFAYIDSAIQRHTDKARVEDMRQELHFLPEIPTCDWCKARRNDLSTRIAALTNHSEEKDV